MEGVRGAPATPAQRWVPPERGADSTAGPSPVLPADLAERVRSLTLADIIDIGLQKNPATRVSWANARAAAAGFGASKGEYYPHLDASLFGTRLKSVASQGRSAVKQTTYGPTATLSWLLFDFGGRSGAIEGARQALLSADWVHNATLQNVVLDIQTAYYQYLDARALYAAQQTTVREARANLAAAEERRRVGVGTIADVLQAKTALSQARLALETTEGSILTTRGALAVSMGLPANLPYDVDSVAAFPVAGLADSVEVLIDQAMALRPDLAAARADFLQARARIGELRAARLPSLTLGGTAGRTYVHNATGTSQGNNYSATVTLQIPLFAGFSRIYTQQQAEALADAARARSETLQSQVVFQVFSSYYAFQTATRRVATADDLLASAQQSAEVALARYKAGVGNLLDLLSAQSALADARAQQVQSRWIWATALAQLAHDAGVLDLTGQSPIRLTPETTDTIPR